MRGPLSVLTPREESVLAALITGATNAEIARELGLTHKTVSNYVSVILSKLEARNRTHATALAFGSLLAPERSEN